MWDYSEKVMDHYRNPRNVGKIDNPDAVGEAGSLACGDSLKLYLKIENGIIGKPVEEVKKITNKDIADQLGGLPPEKMHCSVMGHEALEDALKNYFDEEITIPLDEKVVCQCFNVTENQILEAIETNNLKTVEDVTNYTKAGGACGRCKSAIKAILDSYWAKKDADKPKLTQTQKILKINSVIENQISPELQKDGGDIELIDIEDNKVYVKLRGRCSGCKNSHMTLKIFVEQTLRETVSSKIDVIEVQ